MKRRPWPFVLIAVAEGLLIPFVFLRVSRVIPQAPVYTMIQISLSFAAAFAILKFAKWSYQSTLVLLVGLFVFHLGTAALASPIYLWFVVADLLALRYFTYREIKEFYKNRNLHWWKAQRRFTLNIRAHIRGPHGNASVLLKNISVGGLFIEAPADSKLAKELSISFLKLKNVNVRLVRHTSTPEVQRYRARFINLSQEHQSNLEELIFALEGKEKPIWSDNLLDFKTWALRSSRTRDGWIPNSNKKSKTF